MTTVRDNVCSFPADQFYWGVLDVSSLPRRYQQSRDHLGYLLEPLLPVPLADVQFDGVRVGRTTQWIACALPTERFESVSDDEVVLRPESIPECVMDAADGTVSAEAFNLLHSRFESPTVARVRRHWLMTAAGIAVMFTALACVGLHRRAVRYADAAQQLRVRQNDVYVRVVGRPNGTQSRHLQMLAELRTYQRVQSAESQQAMLADVVPIFAALTSRWPDDLSTRTEKVFVRADGLDITTNLATSDEVQALAESLAQTGERALPRFDVPNPSLRQGRDGVQASLRPAVLREGGGS
jgi:hypothetical protein